MIRVGQRLQQERFRRKLTIEEVAKGTRIRPQFLIALEKGDYKKLPSRAYAQGFIKNYAGYLGLSIKEILAIFRREFNESEFLDVLPESFTNPKKRVFAGFRLNQAAIYIGILILFILGFVSFQYKAAFFSPNLVVRIPPENATITSPQVKISGSTEHNATVTVNDIATTVSDDGSFNKNIIVLAGTTDVTIKATNNFGKTTTVIRHINVSLKPQ